MALKLLQPGVMPLGQFDGLDTQVLTWKGGTVVTFASILATVATDKAAHDLFDGYVGPSAVNRAVVTSTIGASQRPLMLADEGITGYGTLFGTVFGGTVGQTVYGPNSTVASADKLGPHTATGSGKVTCWTKPGLYAVSLDAVDMTASTGLATTNATLATGDSLYATSAGLITPNSSGNSTNRVGHFVMFSTDGSLVTTPSSLTGGSVTYKYAVFYFDPAIA